MKKLTKQDILKKWDSSKTNEQLRKIFCLKRETMICRYKKRFGLKNKLLKRGGHVNWKNRLKKWNPKLHLNENAKRLNVTTYWAYIIKRRFHLKSLTHIQARLNRLRNFKIVSYLKRQGFKETDIARLYHFSRERIRQMKTQK